MVEQRTENPCVGSSILPLGTAWGKVGLPNFPGNNEGCFLSGVELGNVWKGKFVGKLGRLVSLFDGKFVLVINARLVLSRFDKGECIMFM